MSKQHPKYYDEGETIAKLVEPGSLMDSCRHALLYYYIILMKVYYVTIL